MDLGTRIYLWTHHVLHLHGFQGQRVMWPFEPHFSSDKCSSRSTEFICVNQGIIYFCLACILSAHQICRDDTASPTSLLAWCHGRARCSSGMLVLPVQAHLPDGGKGGITTMLHCAAVRKATHDWHFGILRCMQIGRYTFHRVSSVTQQYWELLNVGFRT
jgi:hypothetical protein